MSALGLAGGKQLARKKQEKRDPIVFATGSRFYSKNEKGPVPVFRMKVYIFEIRLLSNLTPAMLGPKLPPPRNQNRVSCVIHLSTPACLLFHRSESE